MLACVLACVLVFRCFWMAKRHFGVSCSTQQHVIFSAPEKASDREIFKPTVVRLSRKGKKRKKKRKGFNDEVRPPFHQPTTLSLNTQQTEPSVLEGNTNTYTHSLFTLSAPFAHIRRPCSSAYVLATLIQKRGGSKEADRQIQHTA